MQRGFSLLLSCSEIPILVHKEVIQIAALHQLLRHLSGQPAREILSYPSLLLTLWGSGGPVLVL